MIITLLTDFGTADYFVGAMKGVILSINEKAQIIDITHEIPPQIIASASFVLRSCYKDFPKKTIFVAVVDPGVGSSRRAILVETEKYLFLAPDNGLLSFVFEEEKNFSVYELTDERFFRRPLSQTFHGRDIFAPVAAHLSRGVSPEEFGISVKDFIILKQKQPKRVSANRIEAEIIYIDRFGNLVTNLKKTDLSAGFVLEINGARIEKQQSFYRQAGEGEFFMIWGSAGFLEVAVFEASAKSLLNAKIGEKIYLTENEKSETENE